MVEFTEYRAGTPSWVDLAASDPEAARRFYGDLFGWDYDIGGEETGGYSLCKSGSNVVGGIGGPPPDGVPVVWTTFFATDDVDASAGLITSAGGTLMMEPMDVMEQGRMVMALDSGGAAFGLWQAGVRHGADIANEPVSLAWSELSTPDLDAAGDFYNSVFGYYYGQEASGEFDYRMFSLEPDPGVGEGQGYPMGGMMALPAPEVPPHWAVYFAVADADQTVATAKDLGGQILREPQDSPYGRMAGIQDPQGATFQIVAMPT